MHFGWLHTGGIRNERSLADGSCHDMVLTDLGPGHVAEIGGRVRTVQNVALDASLLHHALMAARANRALTTWALARAMLPMLLRLF